MAAPTKKTIDAIAQAEEIAAAIEKLPDQSPDGIVLAPYKRAFAIAHGNYMNTLRAVMKLAEA